MRRILDNIADLVKVKTLVTLAMVGAYVALALSGRLDMVEFVRTTTIVIAFYFGTQNERKNGGGDGR